MFQPARMPCFKALFAIVIALAGACAPAQAQLYAREAPAGSAFVRAYNNTAGAGVALTIANKIQPPMLSYAPSAYLFLPPGDVPLEVGPHSKTVKLLGGHYYTAVASADGIAMYELSGVLNRTKAMIALFNLMPDTTLGMKTVEGKIAVFEGVKPGTSVQREINPLKLNVALFDGDQQVSVAPTIALGSGKVFSLFVGGTRGSPVMVWNED